MKKHFITGGTGFIGRNLVRELVKNGDGVYLLIRPSSLTSNKSVVGIFDDIKDKISFIEGDITKLNLGISKNNYNNLKKAKVDFIWHLAANLAFNQNLNDRVRFRANTVGTQHVVEFANGLGAVLCHCSTAYVCGSSKYFFENTLDDGQSFRNSYEKTKFLGEKIVNCDTKVPFIIFRPSLVIDKPVIGKASNCTFGYFRYVYMFYLFRERVVKTLKQRGFLGNFLFMLGAKIENGTKLKLPFLILPYPKNINVNMVPIDYVIDCMVRISKDKKAYGKTFHLTHPKPRSYFFLMKTIFNNLEIGQLKYLAVPPFVFKAILNLTYFILVPWRGWVKSALLYLPYVSTSPVFERRNINLYNKPPKLISKEYFTNINKKAFKIFAKIN